MFSRKEISVLEHWGNVFPLGDLRRLGFQMWAVPGKARAGRKGGPPDWDRAAPSGQRVYIWKLRLEGGYCTQAAVGSGFWERKVKAPQMTQFPSFNRKLSMVELPKAPMETGAMQKPTRRQTMKWGVRKAHH